MKWASGEDVQLGDVFETESGGVTYVFQLDPPRAAWDFPVGAYASVEVSFKPDLHRLLHRSSSRKCPDCGTLDLADVWTCYCCGRGQRSEG